MVVPSADAVGLLEFPDTMCMGLGEIEGVAVFVEDVFGQEKLTSDVGFKGPPYGISGKEFLGRLPCARIDYSVVLSGIWRNWGLRSWD